MACHEGSWQCHENIEQGGSLRRGHEAHNNGGMYLAQNQPKIQSRERRLHRFHKPKRSQASKKALLYACKPEQYYHAFVTFIRGNNAQRVPLRHTVKGVTTEKNVESKKKKGRVLRGGGGRWSGA